MKAILFTCFILLSVSVNAQQITQKPKYDEIGALLKQPGENNYKTLLNRLQSSDTSLLEQHYYVLYYGQSLQENYSPYNVRNKYLFDLLKNRQFDDFISNAADYLTQAPFDLQIREYLINQLYQKGDTNTFNVQLKILNGFVDALLQSGLGKSPEDPIHVMSVSDEYVFLNMIGLKYTSRKTQSPYDIFVMEKNKYDLKEIYFDISVPIQKLNDLLNVKH